MVWPTGGVTLMADGAINPRQRRWGVGICGPLDDLDVYAGGSMDDITLPDDPRSIQKSLSVEVAEAAALWMAVCYARALIEHRARSASNDTCEITLVTDRPATMASLRHQLLNCCKAYKCKEFEAILRHLSQDFARLCKAAGGEVSVRWKGDLEHLCYLKPNEWQPDTLAHLGIEKSRGSLALEWYPLCPHIAIQLTQDPHNNSLVTKAIVSLKTPIKIHAPSQVTHGHPELHLQLSQEEAIAAAGLPDNGGTNTEGFLER